MLSFKYRVYPTKKQQRELNRQMFLAKELYNYLFEKAQEKYKTKGETLTKFDMTYLLVDLKKEHPEYTKLYSQVSQNVCDRLSKAYSNFFKRCKRKKKGENIKVGFPKFKKFVSSLTYPQNKGAFKFKNEHRVYASKIGSIPIVLHRIPKGNIKAMTIKKHESGKWYVTFSCETEETKNVQHKSKEVGLDVGLLSFATLSDGTKIENPKYLKKSLKKIKRLQRRLSKKKKGSKNRRKAVLRLTRAHENVANERKDFQHKLSTELVNNYSLIAVEDLKVQNMVKNHHLAQSISDASWSSFMDMLQYKASNTGCELVFVDAKYTSQICSKCGNKQKMPLHKRTYNCSCGLKMDRDINAAKNILTRATAGQVESHACGDGVRPQIDGAAVKEAGTIWGVVT